jgi:hypothetical protein
LVPLVLVLAFTDNFSDEGPVDKGLASVAAIVVLFGWNGLARVYSGELLSRPRRVSLFLRCHFKAFSLVALVLLAVAVSGMF